MSPRAWLGGALVVGLGVVASGLLGSRPEARDADAPVAPCPDTPNCARLKVPVAASPPAVVRAVHLVLPDVSGADLVAPTPDGALARFSVGPFTDEVSVAVEAGPAGAALWVRSAATVGRSDLGINARRAERIVEAVATVLAPGAVQR